MASKLLTTAASSFPGLADSRRSRSRARLRAAVTIQPDGLAGTPSRGHVRNASVNASWTASSATERSPDHRASAATAGPHSRRKTPSRLATRRLLEPGDTLELAQLDCRRGNHRCDLDGLVAVVAVDDVVAVGHFGA